jgi:hypothetical protein
MQALESVKYFLKHRDSSKLHFGHKWFTHFGSDTKKGFLRLCHAFLDEVLSQNMMHINNIFILGDE